MSDARVRVTFAGSGDAFGSGGRFQACLYIEHDSGPPGLRQRLIDAMEVFYPGSTGVRRKFEVDVVELRPGGSIRVAGIDVSAWEVDHPSGAPPLALRLDVDGVVVAYTGDTAWTEAIPLVAARADLLVAEAYYLDKEIPYHLNHRTLSDHRNEVDCARIVLTHMSADMLAHLETAVFETAHDGMTIELTKGANG